MCVTICGRFLPDEGAVAGYGNRIRVKYTAKWGVQIAGMIFQTRSRISSKNSNTIRHRNISIHIPVNNKAPLSTSQADSEAPRPTPHANNNAPLSTLQADSEAPRPTHIPSDHQETQPFAPGIQRSADAPSPAGSPPYLPF